MKINQIEKLYHGTNINFDTFDFKKAKGFKDFGKGYYLTSNLSQAQRWAQKKAHIGNKAYIYGYSVEHIDVSEWKILELLEYDEKWVEFISRCRIEGMEPDYDIVYDRMADSQFDSLSEELQAYMEQKATADKVIEKIKWKKEYEADQYCFKNKNSLELLKDREVYVLEKDESGIWRMERE